MERIVSCLSLIFKGGLIGIANIIPGVSGGTMAMVLGIYERMIRSLNCIGISTVREFLSFKITGIRQECQRIDIGFLFLIAVGAAMAIVTTSKLIVLLITEQHDPTYGFFCGLILLSILTPLRMMKRFHFYQLIPLSCAIVLTVGLTISMGGEKTLEKEKQKYKIEQLQENLGGQDMDSRTDRSVGRLAYLFIVGSIAISAMILPGISGSFVMLLFGVYFEVLLAINNRDLTLLITFAIGCGLGLLAFTRLLHFLLEQYYDLTVSFLVGLMLGSLYGLWPFREFEVVNSQRIDFAHVLPGVNTNLAITFVAFLLGCVIILLFYWFEKLNQRT
ncbi:TPA: DUF368 domain-containing protein [Candidatus Poribacteria bacterium]|nr:DUF368 domain-containing protein [Candidatus Poribacteria bacterium]HIC01136.1 DUF368 domain-containing protein [Candidatus Poribacteria bacterium]HIN27820.1 DUF368 domain-containing protein [Candidatus Poribacteria bacterium]HIO46155.1 DUF368 domain-containing protein [Candidatus Poribacteria bacterium]